MPAPAGYEEVQAPKGPPSGYEEIPAPREAPVTMNAKRGGSTTTQPDVNAAAIDSRAKTISDKAANSFGFMAGGGLEKIGEEAPTIIPAIKGAWGKVFPPKSVYPGAELPEAPSTEVLQANRGLGQGARPVPEPASALRKLPASPIYPGAPLPSADIGSFPGAHLPEAPPGEVLQGRGLTKGAKPAPEPSSALGKLSAPRIDPVEPPSIRRTPGQVAPEMIRPRAYTARTAEPIPARPGLALPPAPETPVPRAEYPPVNAPRPVRLTPEPGSPEDIAETKDIQHQMKDAAEAEDRNRLLAVQRDRFPQRTKFDLTNEPVKFTKTPGVSRPDGVKPGTVVPAAEQNLTGLLKKSLAAAKKAKK